MGKKLEGTQKNELQHLAPVPETGHENQAFDEENDDANRPSDVLPKSDIQIESQRVKESVVKKHRDKSRELGRKIPADTDPNEVTKEMGIVRERIQSIIKSRLSEQLDKARGENSDDDNTSPSRNKDLKLDLTSATDLNASLTNTNHRMSTTDRIEQLMKQIKVF